MSREQLILLIYHELRHIGHDEGKIIHHDVEDWSNIVATFGTAWSTTKEEIINIIDDEFESENWMQIMPTRRQITLFDKAR